MAGDMVEEMNREAVRLARQAVDEMAAAGDTRRRYVMDDVGPILGCIKAQEVDIYDVDIERGRKDRAQHPSAVFSLRLRRKRSHSQVVAAIAKLECIRMIDEI